MMQSHEAGQSPQGERRSKNEEIVEAGQLVLCVEHHQGHETHETECHQTQSFGHHSAFFGSLLAFISMFWRA